jgi:hypothetical protein
MTDENVKLSYVPLVDATGKEFRMGDATWDALSPAAQQRICRLLVKLAETMYAVSCTPSHEPMYAVDEECPTMKFETRYGMREMRVPLELVWDELSGAVREPIQRAVAKLERDLSRTREQA